MLASPVAEIPMLPNTVVPSSKVTVPIATRLLPAMCGVTLAVKLTGVPKAIVLEVESTSVVVVATGVLFSEIVGETLVLKFSSAP
jgi:hypothetical protein